MNQHRLEIDDIGVLLLTELDPQTWLIASEPIPPNLRIGQRIITAENILGFRIHPKGHRADWCEIQQSSPLTLGHPYQGLFQDVSLGNVRFQLGLFRAPNLEILLQALKDIDILIGGIFMLEPSKKTK